jgi:hypothetical protein
MDKEQWNNVYFSTMAMASVVVGVLGVVVGLLALQRSQPQATGVGSLEPPTGYAPLGVNIPRVHYDDGEVLVQVRNPGEWHDIRDFVQPANPEVNSAINRALYG